MSDGEFVPAIDGVSATISEPTIDGVSATVSEYGATSDVPPCVADCDDYRHCSERGSAGYDTVWETLTGGGRP